MESYTLHKSINNFMNDVVMVDGFYARVIKNVEPDRNIVVIPFGEVTQIFELTDVELELMTKWSVPSHAVEYVAKRAKKGRVSKAKRGTYAYTPFKCGRCGSAIFREQKVCINCGVFLDWSDIFSFAQRED